MKLLIAGAGGYLGIPICEALAARGHDVWAADRWFFGKKPSGENIKIVTKDIRSIVSGDTIIGITMFRDGPPTVTKEVSIFNGVDAVIDVCGLSNDLTSDIDPEMTRSINIEGGKRLATLAKQAGVRRYVYSSSCSVYGAGVRPNLTETDDCRPLTLYARSKVEVEDHLRSIAGDGFDPVILRNATVFGVAPRMRFDLAVNIMALRAWRDQVIMVMGGGEQWRPFIHVDDVVRAFVWAVESNNAAGETFNVGTSNHTIAEVSKKVASEFPMARIMPIPDDPDKRSYSCSFDKWGLGIFPKATTTIYAGEHHIEIGEWIHVFSTMESEISRMAKMLRDGSLKDDPTCYTLQWYKSLLDWDRRLSEIRLDGKIL